MRTVFLAFLTILSLFSLGCSSTQQMTVPAVTTAKPDVPVSTLKAQELLIGNWAGEALLKEGGYRRSLVERQATGKYKLTIRIYKDKDGPLVKEQVEVGEWGVSGPVYFTNMRGWIKEGKFVPSDPSSSYYRDGYQIISISPDKFEYQNLETGNRFTVSRVGVGFKLPS